MAVLRNARRVASYMNPKRGVHAPLESVTVKGIDKSVGPIKGSKTPGRRIWIRR